MKESHKIQCKMLYDLETAAEVIPINLNCVKNSTKK